MMTLPDPALLTARGASVRPLLASGTLAVRDLLREQADWDDEEFWALVTRIGAHEGPFVAERPRPTATDRRAKVKIGLTYEWDESGTTIYADAHAWPVPGDRLWRVRVARFRRTWELEFSRAFDPRKLRLTPDTILVLDRGNRAIAKAARPDRAKFVDRWRRRAALALAAVDRFQGRG